MDRMKEYLAFIAALVTVMAAMSALGLWAIQVQIDPEIRRLDGRIDSLQTEMTTRLDRVEDEIKSVRADVNTVRADVNTVRGEVLRLRGEFEGLRREFEGLRGEVHVIRADVNTIRDDIKTILLRLPKPNETGMTVRGTP